MEKRVASGQRLSDWTGFVVFFAWSLVFIGMIAKAVKIAPITALFLVPSIVCEIVVAMAFLIRHPARDRLVGWRPRAVAHSGAFLLPIFFALTQRWHADWLKSSDARLVGVGAALWLFGTVLCLWTIWTLRRAFSIEPQARELITGGPYRLVRHPIYASYFLQYAGLWMARMTIPVTVAVSVWVILMLARMRFEEQVLARAFPEYGRYSQQTGRITPRIFGSRPSPASAQLTLQLRPVKRS